jgi:hypothetical protein
MGAFAALMALPWVRAMGIAIVTANTFGIETAEIVTKRLLSGRTVTTTEMTFVLVSSTAIDQ